MSVFNPKSTQNDFPESALSKLFTPKELVIIDATLLYRFEQDFSITETADKLHISVPTYKTHINHIYKKLNVHSLLQFKIAIEWLKNT